MQHAATTISSDVFVSGVFELLWLEEMLCRVLLTSDSFLQLLVATSSLQPGWDVLLDIIVSSITFSFLIHE